MRCRSMDLRHMADELLSLSTPLMRRQVDLALLVGLELLRRFRSRRGLSVAER